MNYENSLISLLINNPEKLSSANLRPVDFTNSTCRSIFNAMQIISVDTPVDIVTISDFLHAETGQDWVRSVGFLANQPYSLKNINLYTKKIISAAKQNQVRQLCASVLESESEIDIGDFTAQLMAMQRVDKKWLSGWSEGLIGAFHEIEENIGKSGPTGIKTGFNSLDEKMSGWHKSDLTIIGARPAMGKTALLLTLSRLCDARALVISAEMSKNQVFKRLISQASGVAAKKLRDADLNDFDWNALTCGTVQLKEKLDIKPSWLFDKPGPTIYEIAQQARAAKHEHDIEIMFVDYLQIIRAPGKSRVEEIEEVAMGLKSIARELDIPVIALAQVNRDCTKRADPRPTMADLKGSGSIEQEADQIFFLYRPNVDNENAPENEAELICEKNRHGGIGTIYLDWNPSTMNFTDNQGWQQ